MDILLYEEVKTNNSHKVDNGRPVSRSTKYR